MFECGSVVIVNAMVRENRKKPQISQSGKENARKHNGSKYYMSQAIAGQVSKHLVEREILQKNDLARKRTIADNYA